MPVGRVLRLGAILKIGGALVDLVEHRGIEHPGTIPERQIDLALVKPAA